MRKRIRKYCLQNNKTYKEVMDNMYVLKCDISKFFYSIDRKILFDILKDNVKGDKFLEFIFNFIFTDNGKVGILIGNCTLQYFVNIYLNQLDYYVKYVLKVKSYFKYVDDFLCLITKKNARRYYFI